MLLLPSAGFAAACYHDTDIVAVTGTIHMVTLPQDSESANAAQREGPWTYSTLIFDDPICIKSDFHDVPNGKVASVFFLAETEQKFTEGQHVTLRGQLSPPDNGAQPPEPLMLTITDK